MKTTHINIFIVITCFLFSCSNEETPPYAVVSGFVNSIQNMPLEDVTVTIEEKSDQIFKTTYKGYYEFTVDAPGSGTLIFEKAGFITEQITYNCIPGEKIALNTIILKREADPEPEPENPDPELPKPFFIVNAPDTIKQNLFGDSYHFSVKTSAKKCIPIYKEEWLSIKETYYSQYESEFYFNIYFEENPLEELRRSMIILTTETELRDTIWLEQTAGPALAMIDYSGKDEKCMQPGEIPFIKFNRKIEIIYIENTKISNIIYEEDSTLVRIPDIDVLPYQIDYSFTAISKDGQSLMDNLSIIPPYLDFSYISNRSQ